MASKSAAVRPPRRVGSVQRAFVAAQAITSNLLCLGIPGSPQSYVGVLEVSGISYDLKSFGEQERLNDLFQSILSGLTFDVQILWRSLPLRIEPYLRRFTTPVATSGEMPTVWQSLAASHVSFVQHLTERRTLLNRQIYLLARFTSDEPTSPGLKALFLPGARRMNPALALERARQQLDMRLKELARRLDLLGLSTRRLQDVTELAQFYQSCLAPVQAARYPLAAGLLAGVDRPVTCEPRNAGVARTTPDVPLPNERPSRQTLFPQLADLLAPASIEVEPERLKIGGEYHRVLLITGLPRTVEAGWMRPLMELDEPFELSLHLCPLDSAKMDALFQRKRTQFQSTRLLSIERGRVLDPHLKVAESDVEELSQRVASGAERMFEVFWFVRVWGESKQALDERAQKIQNVLKSMRLSSMVTAWEQAQGYRSCLPHVRPQVQAEGLLLSSEATSTTFPFVSTSLFHEEGVLFGITPTGEMIVVDPWDQTITNANMVVFGPSGQGKSTLVKTIIERLAVRFQVQRATDEPGCQIYVVDPEGEYGILASALGGQRIVLSPGSPDKINPFDLPQGRRDPLTGEELSADPLSEQIQRIHDFLNIALAGKGTGSAGLTEAEDSLIDLALFDTYEQVGITRDPRTHQRPAPLIADFTRVLAEGKAAGKWEDKTELLPRLLRFTQGSMSGLFTAPTTLDAQRPIVVFDTSTCKTDLQQIIAQFLISTFVWGQASRCDIPRFLVFDEAATWLHYPSGKKVLEEYAQRARKYFLSLIAITQHPSTFANSTLVDNSAFKFLMRPDAVSLDLIREMFKLSEREGQYLLRLQKGEALLLIGQQRTLVKNEVSELELVLAQTNPKTLAERMTRPEFAPQRALLQQLGQGSFQALLELARGEEQI